MVDDRGVVFECVQDIRADLFFEFVRPGEVVGPVCSHELQEVLAVFRRYRIDFGRLRNFARRVGIRPCSIGY